MKRQDIELTINMIPNLGIIIFAILFFYSSILYPGGSQENLTSAGFDWINNYWCNLLNEHGMNGQKNPARPFAIFAMTILCFSISVFFYQFAEVLTNNTKWKKMIKVSGLLSMIFAILMFTDYHDVMTLLSSLFGLIAVLGIIKEIYNSPLTNYKLTGILCIILLGINNLIYYSNQFINWLPLLQKITILLVLLWVLFVNKEIRSKLKSGYNNNYK